MTTNEAPHKPFALGLKKTLIVESELDSDGDLEFMLETECEYSNHYVFLSPSDQVKLRDRLDRLIGDKKMPQPVKPVPKTREEMAAFAKDWDAKVDADRAPKPVHRANGTYLPIGDLGGEYCVKCLTSWPCDTQRYIDSGDYEGEYN